MPFFSRSGSSSKSPASESLGAENDSLSWHTFWNGDHSIYVCERHKCLHYERVAKMISDHLGTTSQCVLDYGCGEALFAGTLASEGHLVLLYDTAKRVRHKLSCRFGASPNCKVLTETSLSEVQDSSLHLIVANSVIQYMTSDEFRSFLAYARKKLVPTGKLLLADVIPRGNSAYHDASALLRFSAKNGFLGSAVVGLLKTFFSSYRTLRSKVGLSKYDTSELLAILQEAGFEAALQPTNLGISNIRKTYVALPIVAF